MLRTGGAKNLMFLRWQSFILLSLVVTVLVFFQNCGNDRFIASVNNYTTPFSEKKVLLKISSFEDAKTGESLDEIEDKDSGRELVTKKELPLVVLINNLCASRSCSQANQNTADSVVCHLYDNQLEPDMKNIEQNYNFQLPERLSPEQVSEYFSQNTIDNACLVGVTNKELYEIVAAPNDTYYSSNQKAYLDAINYETGIDLFKAAEMEQIKVAVIDTGIAQASELPNVVYREDVRSNANKSFPNCPAYSNNQPNHFHGTFVGGIIGAKSNNSAKIAGIASNVKLYSFAVGNCHGGGISNVELGNSILKATSIHKVDIINLSLGSFYDDPALRSAIVNAMARNTMVVTAAGNNNFDLDTHSMFPAKYSVDYTGVITVAATDSNKNKASFSNFSSSYVNIAAPGVQIASIITNTPGVQHQLDSDVGISQGTSFSTPIVTGALALLLGRLRYLNISYDMKYARDLLTSTAAEFRGSLTTVSQNGAFLDLQRVGTVVNGLQSGVSQGSLNMSYNLDDSGSSPILNIAVDWNLVNAHPGARLGVFDSSGFCNYSVGCLLKDFDLSQLKGSQQLSLTLNEIAPMMPDLRDPQFSLFLSAAVYYPVPKYNFDGEQVGYENVFGIDAEKSINLRDIDSSKAGSQLLGEVTSIRHDMVNAYIQGWSCFEGDNALVTVDLINTQGQVLTTKYVYTYPRLMFPHKVTYDNSYWPIKDTKEYSFNMAQRPSLQFLADDLHDGSQWKNSIHKYSKSHLSGTESNPQLIDRCHTLTGAHGFEFVIPLKDILHFTDKKFRVRARYKTKSLTLRDNKNRAWFDLPDLTEFNKVTDIGFNIDRAGQDYNITGDICAPSPAPIEVEVSFNYWDYRLALMNHTNPGGGYKGGYVYDPSETRKAHLVAYFQDFLGNPATYKSSTIDVSDYPESTLYEWFFEDPIISKMVPGFNAYVGCGAGAKSAQYVAAINSLGLQSVDGKPVTLHCDQVSIFPAHGTAYTQHYYDNSDRSVASSSIKTIKYPWAWDWYDVGVRYSTFLLGYQLDTSRSVGKYIYDTYGISSLLREVKKYETPNKSRSHVFGLKELGITGTCAGGFSHKLSYTVPNIIDHSVAANKAVRGFWLKGQNPANYGTHNLATTMSRLPITLRFFQDGKMIKHIVSDYNSNFTNIDYPFLD